MFNNFAFFTDCHFGNKNNSEVFNQDCLDCFDFIIKECKKENIKTLVFGGDFFHNRATLNVSTINYAITGMNKLQQNFDKIYLILGNHDLYYRNRRDIHSIKIFESHDNVKVIDKITQIDDMLLVPWLVNDEWQEFRDTLSSYTGIKKIVGHFELPYFKLNSKVTMHETGKLKASDLASIDYVFSGHFHTRQTVNNINYCGAMFPHNFADERDNDRGFMIFKDKPIMKIWDKAPTYKLTSMKSVLLDNNLKEKSYVKSYITNRTTTPVLNFIKESLIGYYKLREVTFVPVTENNIENFKFENTKQITNINDIVTTQLLEQVESQTLNKEKLARIFREA